MASAQYNDLRAKAEQWQKEVRRRLEEMNGVGDPKAFAAGTPFGNPNHRGLFDDLGGQSLNMQYGATPSDADVNKFIQMIGGNPYMRKIEQMAAAKKSAGSTSRTIQKEAANALSAAFPALQPYFQDSRRRRRKGEKSTLQAFLDDAQAQYDRANAANEARYGQMMDELGGIRERNMDRVANYGKAAAADLEERSNEALRDIRANLSARGLGNSTIFDAFRQRSARDLANEQQRLSERVDSRSAEYDTNLTNQLVGAIERRNDVAPDFAQIAALAQQYGLANDGYGYYDNYGGGYEMPPMPYVPPPNKPTAVNPVMQQAERNNIEYTAPAAPRYAPIAGVSPRAAAKMANNIRQGFAPMANAPIAGFDGTVRGSNAYPQRRERVETPPQAAGGATNAAKAAKNAVNAVNAAKNAVPKKPGMYFPTEQELADAEEIAYWGSGDQSWGESSPNLLGNSDSRYQIQRPVDDFRSAGYALGDALTRFNDMNTPYYANDAERATVRIPGGQGLLPTSPHNSMYSYYHDRYRK